MPNYIDNTCKLMDAFSEWEQPAKALYSEKHYKEALALVLMLVSKKMPIMIYADFDMDGFGAATSLHRYLLKLYSIVHGYKKGETEKCVGLSVSDPRNGFGLTMQEFSSFIKSGYRLVITVDNGTDSEVVKKGRRGLLVLDHHPSSNSEPYILNPNAGRKDGISYGTSGGKVVYDFIRNLDRNIIKQNIFPDYIKYRSPEMMKAIRAIAAITLVSDMATLDKHNRDFFISAVEDECFSPHLLPVFERIGKEPTSRNISFNLISQGNAFGRMLGHIEKDIKKDVEILYGEGATFNLSMVIDWLAPPRYLNGNIKTWWDKLDKMADKINLKKKGYVSEALQYYLSRNGRKEPEGGHIFFVNDRKMPPRLTGLLANKIGSIHGMIPTIVATEREDGYIAMSGRGYDVKDVFDLLFKDENMPFSGDFGGHQDACGAHIVYDAEKYNPKEVYDTLRECIGSAAKKLGLENKNKKIEVVVPEPVSVYELRQLGEQYKERCRGIDFYKRFYVPVSGYNRAGLVKFGSGYCNISICDKESMSSRITILVDGNTTNVEQDIFGSDENVMLVELTSSGDFGFLRSFDDIEEFYRHTEVMPEAKSMYDVASIREKNINAYHERSKRMKDSERIEKSDDSKKPQMPQPSIVSSEEDIAKMIQIYTENKDRKSPIHNTVVLFGSEHKEIINAMPVFDKEGGVEAIMLDTTPCSKGEIQSRKEAYGEVLQRAVNAQAKEGKRVVLPDNGIGVSNGFYQDEPVLHSLAMGVIVNVIGCSDYKPFLDNTVLFLQESRKTRSEEKAGAPHADRGQNGDASIKRQEKGKR